MPRTTTVHSRGRIASSAKRLLVSSAGFMLCGAGLTMLVLPGPGMLVIVLGLVVLATEYTWAERALERTRVRAADATRRLHTSRTARLGVAVSAAAMLTGGAAVAAYLDGHRYVGVSLLVGGAGALALLVPAAQRLIDQPRPSTAEAPVTAHADHSPTSSET